MLAIISSQMAELALSPKATPVASSPRAPAMATAAWLGLGLGLGLGLRWGLGLGLGF